MNINEILRSRGQNVQDIINLLKTKPYNLRSWSGIDGLQREYCPDKHPVMDKGIYPDIVNEGRIIYVTRITCNFQQLAVKRMTELVTGIPVKRVYSTENDRQEEIATYLEKIFTATRIDSVNVERLNMLYASCEVMTLWYAVEQSNTQYGFKSGLKLRCKNYSPMNGDEIYPYFDEFGDLVALSVGYERKVAETKYNFFDVYTNELHIRYNNEGGAWSEVLREDITLLKIPAIYMYRPTPIWEHQSNKIFDIEWSLSRNGNYLRENSRPVFAVFADEAIPVEESPQTDGNGSGEQGAGKDILQLPMGTKAEYVTWAQAIENLKFYIEQLRSLFFTELQLPDWSYEKMSQHALSGESRKQMFIDAQLKVKDESGRLLEFFQREVNVVKAFLKVMLGDRYAEDIDALPVEVQITPFTITDEQDTIDKLLKANGGEPIISQRESIEQLGWSDNVDQTLKEIHEQGIVDAMSFAE